MTYSLWQSDERIYSLGGRVRKTAEPTHTQEPPRDWTQAEMQRLEIREEKDLRRLAIRAVHPNRNGLTT